MDPLKIMKSFFFKLSLELKNIEMKDVAYFLSPYYPSLIVKRKWKLILSPWYMRGGGEGGVGWNPAMRFRYLATFWKEFTSYR